MTYYSKFSYTSVVRELGSMYTLIFGLVGQLLTVFGYKNNFISIERLLIRLSNYNTSVANVSVGDFSVTSDKSIGEWMHNFGNVIREAECHLENPYCPRSYELMRSYQVSKNNLERVKLGLAKNIIRKQPFGILVSGTPGCGKSFGSLKLAKDLYTAIHGHLDASEVVILNESDDYQSEYRTYHKIVGIDDLGASRSSVTGKDPFRKIIDFINNVCKTAINPHLELKGNVWIEPEIVFATTNIGLPLKFSSECNTGSVLCVEAIARRFKLQIKQYGYDKFLIVDDEDHYNNHGDLNRKDYQSLNMLTYNQLLPIALERYRKHLTEQEYFVQMVREEFLNQTRDDVLKPESALLCTSTYAMIVYLQELVRIFVAKQAFYGNMSESYCLLILKRFASLDLQSLKTTNRRFLYLILKANGVNGIGLQEFITGFETVIRLSADINVLALDAVLDYCDADGNNQRVVATLAAISSNLIVRRIVGRSSYPWIQKSYLYDMCSIILPNFVGRLSYLNDSPDRSIRKEKWTRAFYACLYDISRPFQRSWTFQMNLLNSCKETFSWILGARSKDQQLHAESGPPSVLLMEVESVVNKKQQKRYDIVVPIGDFIRPNYEERHYFRIKKSKWVKSNCYSLDYFEKKLDDCGIVHALEAVGACTTKDYTMLLRFGIEKGKIVPGWYNIVYSHKLNVTYVFQQIKKDRQIRHQKLDGMMNILSHRIKLVSCYLVDTSTPYFVGYNTIIDSDIKKELAFLYGKFAIQVLLNINEQARFAMEINQAKIDSIIRGN